MWYKNNFFKYSTGIILVLLIIFLFGKIDFFLEPFKKFIAVVFFPFLVSGLLYYLLRPLVRLAEKIRIPPTLAILIIYVLLLGVFALFGTYAGSLIASQFQQLIGELPQIIQIARDKTTSFLNNENIGLFLTGKIETQVTAYLQSIIPMIGNSLITVVSTLTSIVSVFLVVPFILFFLLKDDRLFIRKALNLVPQNYKHEITDIIKDTDKTLSVYIIGQAIIALILGILMYIGYLIIGLKFALILALFALIASFIPLLGSVIGIIPAFIVGISENPLMGVKVLIIMIIVQQLEGNLISPYLIGKRLDIHPLTIILIFLAAASLYGFIGMLIAVPTYAVLKVILSGIRKIYRLWKYRRSLSGLSSGL